MIAEECVKHMHKTGMAGWSEFITKARAANRIPGKINIYEESFIKKDFSDFDFTDLRFRKCRFEECRFYGTYIGDVIFEKNCTFINCEFQNTKANNSKFLNCAFYGCSFLLNDADFSKTQFTQCQITRGAIKGTAYNFLFENVDFQEVDFSGFSSLNSTFKDKITWERCVFDETTDVRNSKFENYDILGDQSETIEVKYYIYPFLKRIFYFCKIKLGWSLIRLLKTLKIFEFSAITFLISLFALKGTNELNHILNTSFFDQATLLNIFSTSFILGLASTIFAFLCPPIIVNFSENDWIYINKQPRIIYLCENLKSYKARNVSLFLVLAGGLMAFLTLLFQVVTVIYNYFF